MRDFSELEFYRWAFGVMGGFIIGWVIRGAIERDKLSTPAKPKETERDA